MEQINIEIPQSVENVTLPEPGLLTYYRNLKRRIIWLDSELDATWLEYARMIMMWNKEDKDVPVENRTPIKLYFYSYGGDLDINFCFIDLLKLSKTPVIGINFGVAYSGGAFTYLACHKRYVMPKASFLLHSGSAEGISGTAEQVEAYTAQYKKQIKALKEYLIDYCNIPKKLVDTKMRGEWYVSADEAIELGIAHKIVDDLDEIL